MHGHNGGGCWQRTSSFDEFEEVLVWTEMPQNL
jgi:hypothetical protein